MHLMIKVLEIVMVNLGFTSEAASQIINFYEITAKVKIYKRVKLVFYSSYPRSGYNNPQSGFTDFRKLVLRAIYMVSLVILVLGYVHRSRWGSAKQFH